MDRAFNKMAEADSALKRNYRTMKEVEELIRKTGTTSLDGRRAIMKTYFDLANAEPFQFLLLPREIRDFIYTYMFYSKDAIHPCQNLGGTHIINYINLLQTNKQVYSEAIKILYGQNTFRLIYGSLWKSYSFVNIIPVRNEHVYSPKWTLQPKPITSQTRFFLRFICISSVHLNFQAFKNIFHIVKSFPNLESLEIETDWHYVSTMRWVEECRLFVEQRRIKHFRLYKRVCFVTTQDITWMVLEKPHRNWEIDTEETDVEKVARIRSNKPPPWKSCDGEVRNADLYHPKEILGGNVFKPDKDTVPGVQTAHF